MCLNAHLDIIKFWETFSSVLRLGRLHEPIEAFVWNYCKLWEQL